MPCNLLQLPPEVHLKIIEELLRDEEDNPFKRWDDLMNLSNWSCTCSYFRNFLAPEFFKTVELFNSSSDKSGSSLNAVAKSPRNIHVKQLHVGYTQNGGILSRSVDALLRDLQQFPSLERLCIEFDLGFSDIYSRRTSMDLSAEEETPEEVLEAEESAGWRALMPKIYSALIQNKPPQFKHLEIRRLFWKNVSTFSHAAFHDFLSHLEQFILSIHGNNNWGGFPSKSTREYPALMGKLDGYFFNHLANVTTLSIKAPFEGPLELDGMNHAPLALKADQMPLLANLHLEYIFASPELINFLVGHRDTLEKVSLHECYASPGGHAKNCIYWFKLFTSLVSACPTKLHHFELVSDTPLTGEEQFGMRETESNVPAEVREARTILRQYPGKRLFPYAIYQDEDVMLFCEIGENLASFLKGEDQRTWDQLMELVERNARAKYENNRVRLQVQP